MSIVHPDKKTVLPLLNEPIVKEDGKTKNDCELNAAKRLLPALKEAFPRLEIIISADALFANRPFIELIKNQGFNFIIRFKEGNNKTLMETVQTCIQKGKMNEFEKHDKDNEILHGYRFINDLSLNKTHSDININYLDYWEVDETEKEKNFAWITDITLSRENVDEVMRAGRSRWKIENETLDLLQKSYNCLICGAATGSNSYFCKRSIQYT